MSISWLSLEVNPPVLGEYIIVKKNNGVVKLEVLDVRDSGEWHVAYLMEQGFVKWTDTVG